jgi:hypothetical protein
VELCPGRAGTQEFIREPDSVVIDRCYSKRGGLTDGKIARK